MKVGIVFGTFAPMHLGHLDVVDIAKTEMDKVVVVCCGHEGDRGYPMYPLEKRLELANEQFADEEKVFTAILPDTDPKIKEHWNQQQIWNYWVDRMLLMLFQKELISAKDEIVFYTSEGDYTVLLTNTHQNIKVRKCERIRPISGTMIRENGEEYMDQMAPSFREYYKKSC
ncbi:MAG: adenylyltransferase/cytidyltransferase family protein [Butyrivibrio sp.]|nr:adenylyltransferase/cytidyltransferase family protein [Butyrivibrio sp.]